MYHAQAAEKESANDAEEMQKKESGAENKASGEIRKTGDHRLMGMKTVGKGGKAMSGKKNISAASIIGKTVTRENGFPSGSF